MLQSARVAPNVSAYAYLWGQHNFNANPFAPLGCKVEAHIKPSVRETWAGGLGTLQMSRGLHH